MESSVNNPQSNTPGTYREPKHPKSNNAIAGLIIVAVGAVLLAKQLGTDLPHWLFSWPMFLIALGFYLGAKHSFRNPGWLIPIAIGIFFIADDYFYDLNLMKFFWPVLIIGAGLFMVLKTRRKNDGASTWRDEITGNSFESSENFIESVTIFGGVRKNIIAKDFRGGEAVTVFGGTELNLMQADTSSRITLELVQVFGGTKLIVPAHWKVQTEELVNIFGGLNDKRPLPTQPLSDESRVLILKGTCIFGGIDIKSY